MYAIIFLRIRLNENYLVFSNWRPIRPTCISHLSRFQMIKAGNTAGTTDSYVYKFEQII